MNPIKCVLIIFIAYFFTLEVNAQYSFGSGIYKNVNQNKQEKLLIEIGLDKNLKKSTIRNEQIIDSEFYRPALKGKSPFPHYYVSDNGKNKIIIDKDITEMRMALINDNLPDTVNYYSVYSNTYISKKGSYTGVLKTYVLNDTLMAFNINVIDKSNHMTGKLISISKLISPGKFTYSDASEWTFSEGKKVYTEPFECNLIFTIINNTIRVIEQAQCGHHGVGIDFEDTFNLVEKKK